MLGVLLNVLLVYCLFILFIYFRWRSLPFGQYEGSELSDGFSIIVPYRNESENLESLVRSLDILDYPHELFEVIFVNDHSSDGGEEWLKTQTLTFQRRLLNLQSEQGKKAAITFGIEYASFSKIITLDADCQVQKNWLKHFSSTFSQGNAMVVGSIRLASQGSFPETLQVVEQLALTGVSLSMASIATPVMCNGANLGFRKSVFAEVDGYAGNNEIASGDDQFLLKKFKEGGYKIGYVKSPEHLVTTAAQPTWEEFMQQRLRWAGKWKGGGRAIRLIALLIAFASLAMIAMLVGIGWEWDPWWVIFAILFKIGVDSLLVFQVARDLEVKIANRRWPILGVIYPFYAVYVAIRSNVGQYEWKGRRYSTG